MKRTICMTVLAVALLGAAAAHAYDYNTSSYQAISELKAWNGHIDVYLSNGEEHACSGGMKTRFVLATDRHAAYRLLLSAFVSRKSVQLAYTCGSDGYPWIHGVRVR